jgi:hypothetical protein
MDLIDMLRKFQTDDEDIKVIQLLGMRMFNAFGASLKLALSGYPQNSVLLMRDIMETVFLVDLFKGDKTLIEKWRFADEKTLKNYFSPVAVRKALDERYGHKAGKRKERYKQFSELAGHPNMKSAWMMRPEKNGDAVSGPFVAKDSLNAVLYEMGHLSVEAGMHLHAFTPDHKWQFAAAGLEFLELAQRWKATFICKS